MIIAKFKFYPVVFRKKYKALIRSKVISYTRNQLHFPQKPEISVMNLTFAQSTGALFDKGNKKRKVLLLLNKAIDDGILMGKGQKFQPIISEKALFSCF